MRVGFSYKIRISTPGTGLGFHRPVFKGQSDPRSSGVKDLDDQTTGDPTRTRSELDVFIYVRLVCQVNVNHFAMVKV